MPEPIIVLVDQNIPRNGSRWLAGARPSWSVFHAFDLGLSQATDEDLTAWAEAQSAIVLTFDEDFADVRPDLRRRLAGVIRLRVWPTTDDEVITALKRLFAAVDESELLGSLVIVGRSSIRVRPLTAEALSEAPDGSA